MQILPKIVNIELTNFCNANCKMCTYSTMKRKKGFMNRNTFMIAIDKISKMDSITNIQLHGHGESFMHKDISEFANYAKNKCPKKTISLFTNGVLIQKIPDGFDYIVISFNGGNKETYENIMGLNFENAVEKIKNITPRDKIVLQMLLCRSNINSKKDFEDLWKGWKYGMHDGYYNWAGNLSYDGLRPLPKQGICCRLFIHMSIHWNGIVNLCTQDYEQTTSVGNIITDSIEDIYNNSLFIKKRTEQVAGIWSDICEDCSYCKWEHLNTTEYKKEIDDYRERYTK